MYKGPDSFGACYMYSMQCIGIAWFQNEEYRSSAIIIVCAPTVLKVINGAGYNAVKPCEQIV